MLIDELLNKIGARLYDAIFGWLRLDWLPEIFFWYWWLFVLFVPVALGIWLFGWSKIVRMALSIVFGIAAVFVAGGHYMAHRLKKRGK